MGKGNPNYPDVLLNFFPRVETSFGHESWDSGSIFRSGIDGRRGEKRKTENRFNFSVHRISQVFPPFIQFRIWPTIFSTPPPPPPVFPA